MRLHKILLALALVLLCARTTNGTINISTSIFRERGLFGARYIINFGIGSAYLRTMLGVDHIGGTTRGSVGGFGGSTDFSSTGFALEPGAGVQFNVVKHLV